MHIKEIPNEVVKQLYDIILHYLVSSCFGLNYIAYQLFRLFGTQSICTYTISICIKISNKQSIH